MKLDIIYNMDCLKGMKKLPDESIDQMVTDPPYGIGFMGKEWDKFQKKNPTASQVVNWMSPTMKKDTRGMMEFFTLIWKECLRVLKPGAFAFVMCIPRQDCLARQVISLEDAGFMVSFTSLYHCFASGFPKAQNIGKAVDKRLGTERKVICKQKDIGIDRAKRNPNYHQTIPEIADRIGHKYGYKQKAWDTDITKASSPQAQALDGSYAGFQPKPAVEVVIVAMKPLSEKTYVDQAIKNRKGITWLENGRIPYKSDDVPDGGYGRMGIGIGKPLEHQPYTPKKRGSLKSSSPERKWGYKECVEIGSFKGRFPANLLVSDDTLNDGRVRKSGFGNGRPNLQKNGTENQWTGGTKGDIFTPSDSGSFSRYFSLDAWFDKRFSELPKGVQKTFPFLITPKASKAEKNRGCEGLEKELGHNRFDKCKKCGGYILQNPDRPSACKCEKPEREHNKVKGNFHPTCKPIKLMCYLITLGSREGDVVIDPFIGSGTTAISAKMLKRHYIGYDTEADYCEIAEARISAVEDMLF